MRDFSFILNSLVEEPQDWVFTKYTARHASGLKIEWGFMRRPKIIEPYYCTLTAREARNFKQTLKKGHLEYAKKLLRVGERKR